MSVTGLIEAGRRAAERLMIDTCVVRRPSNDPDPLTGQPTWTVVYTGRAKSQSYESYEQTPEAGGHVSTVQRYSAHLPAPGRLDAPELRVGDEIEWTACPASPLRVGTKERVTAQFDKSLTTAQRVFVDRTVA